MTTTIIPQTLTVIDIVTVPTPPVPWYGYQSAGADARGINGYGYGLGTWSTAGRSRYKDLPDRASNTIILWGTGCHSDDGLNCTTACYDEVRGPKMVWDSSGGMWTLQNCLVYPLLAAAAGKGLLIEEPPGTLKKYGIVSNASWATAIMNQSTATDLWPVITNCMQQYCDVAVDVCKPQWNHFYYPSWYSPSSHEAAVCPDMTITGEKPEVNQDIGGPGVAASLLVQSCILMAAWFFIDLNVGWLQRFCQFIKLIPKEGVGWRVFRFPTQRAAMIIALVEFQKTQVFFALTLQIVLLLAFRNSSLLEADSWMQIQTNLDYFPLLAVSGVAPIVLNLITLRKDTKELEWYILGISTICVVVSTTTGILATSIDPSSRQPQDTKLNLDVCGGFSPLYAAFNPPNAASNSGAFTAFLALPIPLLVMISILLDKLSRSEMAEKRLKLNARLLSLQQSLPRWLQIISRVIIGLCKVVAEAWLLYISIGIGIVESNQSTDAKWTLGQIIAVAIWIPVFVNWSYAALTGIEKAFKHVLSRDYRVVRRSTQELAADENDEIRGRADGDEEALVYDSSASALELRDRRADFNKQRYRILPSSTF